MTHIRITAAALAFLAVLPVALGLFEMAGPMPPLDDEPSLAKTVFHPWYWIYILPVWGLSILLILKANLFSKKAKATWIVLTILFLPCHHVGLALPILLVQTKSGAEESGRSATNPA